MPTLAPPCKPRRLWSAACPSPDTRFSAVSKSDRVVITWSPSGYTPVVPDCPDALSAPCFLITTWQLVKAHGVTRNEPKIHFICYLTVEDAAWLRRRTDFSHIIVSELDAIIKDINLPLKWGLKKIAVRKDSTSVLNWIRAAVTEHQRVNTKGAAEMFILQWVGILKELITEFELSLSMTLVPSTKKKKQKKKNKNRADVLTRIQKRG